MKHAVCEHSDVSVRANERGTSVRQMSRRSLPPLQLAAASESGTWGVIRLASRGQTISSVKLANAAATCSSLPTEYQTRTWPLGFSLKLHSGLNRPQGSKTARVAACGLAALVAAQLPLYAGGTRNGCNAARVPAEYDASSLATVVR